MKENGKKIAGVLMALAGALILITNILDKNIVMAVSGLCIMAAGGFYFIGK